MAPSPRPRSTVRQLATQLKACRLIGTAHFSHVLSEHGVTTELQHIYRGGDSIDEDFKKGSTSRLLMVAAQIAEALKGTTEMSMAGRSRNLSFRNSGKNKQHIGICRTSETRKTEVQGIYQQWQAEADLVSLYSEHGKRRKGFKTPDKHTAIVYGHSRIGTMSLATLAEETEHL